MERLRSTETALLFEVAAALGRSFDLREVMGPVLKKMAAHRGMLRGTITILNRETGEIAIEEAYGLSDESLQKGRYRLGEGVTGRVVQTGRPVVVRRISDEPLFLDRTGARGVSKQDVSFICVPVWVDGAVAGALSADRLYGDDITCDEDLRLLTIVAGMIGQAVRSRQLAREGMRALEDENRRLHEALEAQCSPANMIGRSHAMRRVYALIRQVATSPTTVLLLGESGVGKELVAAAIHFASPRAKQPFIKINCAALPESVVESELFGHERGAFTGAIAQRKGCFEAADGGTLFLDEIGDLPLATQAKLLRALQEREIQRLGGAHPIKIAVRIIAATNRDLDAARAQGRFREDLFYRLNVFPIHIPPLRERRTDILLLADHFVEKYARAAGRPVRRIATPAIDMLMAYHWPGNVRELENCIERAVLLSTDEVIHGQHLPPSLQTAAATGTAPRGSLCERLELVEREAIVEALKESRGNLAAAARALGATERQIGLRVRALGIEPRRFKASYAASDAGERADV